MAQTSTLPARPHGPPARLAVQRAVRTYSFGFAAVLAIGMLVANIVTVHGGFGVADQLANVAPMAIAAMASAPSIIDSGWVQHLAGSVGPIPGGVFTIGLPLVIWFSLRLVPFGRLLYAVGSNDTTAFSSGVNVNAVRVASYGLGGLFAGIGGLALTGLVNAANASNATEYTLVAIAAVVLGGTPLVGGRGGLVGPLLGAFSIYLLQNLLATFAINPAYLQIVYGGILIVAVVLGGAISRDSGGGLRRTGAPLI